MAEVKVTIECRKRWFFWPAAVCIVALGRIGILKSPDKAAQWLVDHAMLIVVH